MGIRQKKGEQRNMASNSFFFLDGTPERLRYVALKIRLYTTDNTMFTFFLK